MPATAHPAQPPPVAQQPPKKRAVVCICAFCFYETWGVITRLDLTLGLLIFCCQYRTLPDRRYFPPLLVPVFFFFLNGVLMFSWGFVGFIDLIPGGFLLWNWIILDTLSPVHIAILSVLFCWTAVELGYESSFRSFAVASDVETRLMASG